MDKLTDKYDNMKVDLSKDNINGKQLQAIPECFPFYNDDKKLIIKTLQ